MNTTQPSTWDLLPPRDRLKLSIFRDAKHQGFKILQLHKQNPADTAYRNPKSNGPSAWVALTNTNTEPS